MSAVGCVAGPHRSEPKPTITSSTEYRFLQLYIGFASQKSRSPVEFRGNRRYTLLTVSPLSLADSQVCIILVLRKDAMFLE
jgi:hypothetical protein